MIFVTVGTQLPFDRLVRTVAEWAAEEGRDDVFAQIGPARWKPSNIETVPFITPEDFRRRVSNCRVIIAHCGMGSILTALQMGKPIVVMPRREALDEHRTDHQFATARKFREMGTVTVAMDERELRVHLGGLDDLRAPDAISPRASEQLIGTIRDFVRGDG